MEVAGLVLGAYPVLILVFEQFKTGAEYFSNWRRFRRQYEGFIRDIEAQQLFLEGTLQDLLCGGLDPYLSGHDSKETFLRIVSDPSYAGWTDPLLTENLKARLDKRYDWYMYTIRRIYDIYQELQEVVDIQALQSSDRTPDWWRYQWERIKKTLFEERYEQHREATRLITELKQMLVLSDAQPPQGKRAVSSIVPFLNRVRSNAYNLHDALKNAWQCHCSSVHKAMLQLERRDYEREDDFNLLFVIRSSKQTIGTSKGDDEYEHDYSCIEREANIKFREGEMKQNQKGNVVENAIVAIIPPSSADVSLSSIAFQSANQSEALLSHSARPVTKSNKSRESIHSTVSSETSSRRFFHDLKDKWNSKLRAPRTNTALELPSAREKKTVSQVSNPATNLITKSRMLTNVNDIQQMKPSIFQDENLAASYLKINSVVQQEPTSNVVQDKEEVAAPAAAEKGFSQDDFDALKEIKASENKISDLCSTLHKSMINSHLEYISGLKTKRLWFLLGQTAIREKESSISLRELLEGEPHRFPPMKRVLVATILASSLLQLQHTQWISEKWSKGDIFFRTRDGRIIFEQLYLATEFPSCGLPVTAVLTLAEDGSNMTNQVDNTSVINMNTTNTTNRQSTMKTASSTLPAIKPSHLKVSLECLGIILIELCLGEPIERHSDKVQIRPYYFPSTRLPLPLPPLTKLTPSTPTPTTAGMTATAMTSPHSDPASAPAPPNHDFCLAIANAWTWEEINAYEPSFSDPIDMCLRFPNLARAGQGRLDEVLADVYDAVVRPLQVGLERRRACF